MKQFFILVLFVLSSTVHAEGPITYFSCPVKEGKFTVTVKFAIKNLDTFKAKGDLIQYPGSDSDMGYISVDPIKTGKFYSRMSNLNGQGGDLTVRRNGDIFLFGDGDGYQFTDLVIWNDDSESDVIEGYVRDYGPAYGDDESFKQFIKCKRSNKKL
ncbi:MAG: hypothetical protein AB7N80_15890 [Bdellovibrionales bacterium]